MKVPAPQIDYYYTQEQNELEYWDDMRFNTHRWVELAKGYFQCSFCKVYHTSTTPINIHPICSKNDYLHKGFVKPSGKLQKLCPNVCTPTYCNCEDDTCAVRESIKNQK